MAGGLASSVSLRLFNTPGSVVAKNADTPATPNVTQLKGPLATAVCSRGKARSPKSMLKNSVNHRLKRKADRGFHLILGSSKP